MSDHNSAEVDWNDPNTQQAIQDASIRAWESRLIYGYWWFLCATKEFIGHPQVVEMDILDATIIDFQLEKSIPCWMENSVKLPNVY